MLYFLLTVITTFWTSEFNVLQYINLVLVVRRVDNAIHGISRYPADKC